MMLSKSSNMFRTLSTTRAFSSTGTTSGSARKMQKLFIDYLDEAQNRCATSGRQVSSSSSSSTSGISSVNKSTTTAQSGNTSDGKPARKMQKLFIEYLDEAQAKIEAKNTQKAT